MRARDVLWIALVVAGTGCAASQTTDGGAWIGTITTEGGVTTVVNEAGSVWGSDATLIEELSIGVAAGDPAYMLGPGVGVWDAGDRIVYADVSVPTVRVYGADGTHIGYVGREGQGPGEYTYPYSAAVVSDGRIAVTNAESGWVDFFDRDFVHLDRWGPHPEDLTATGARLNHALVVGSDGTLYLNYRERHADSFLSRFGWRAIGPEGLGPVILYPELQYDALRNCYVADCSLYGPIRYAPSAPRTLLPTGEIVSGVNDDYSFEIRHTDGTATVIQRLVDPVALSDEEWEYWMRDRRADALLRSPDWSPDWSAEVPRVKPMFQRFFPARDGRLLVLREGPSVRVDPCTEDPVAAGGEEVVPCWQSTQVLDMFDADGRFLGAIQPPAERLRGTPHIEGARITTAVEDDAGTIMLKRYRLEPPGQAQER